MANLLIEKKKLFTPPLEEVVSGKAISKFFLHRNTIFMYHLLKVMFKNIENYKFVAHQSIQNCKLQ